MSDQLLDQGFYSQEEGFDYDSRFQKLIEEGYSFELSKYIGHAWEIFKREAGSFIGFVLLHLVINFILGIIPVVGSFASMVISAPLSAGYFIVASRITNNKPVEFSNFFDGFKYFGPLFLTYLGMIVILAAFALVGALIYFQYETPFAFILLIPFFYFAIAFLWAFMIVVFAGKRPIEALGLSRRIISKNWFSFFALMLVIIGINILGMLALVIGLIVTVPFSQIIIFSAFHLIVGKSDFDTEIR